MIQRMLLCVAVAVTILASSSHAQLPGGKIAYLSVGSYSLEGSTGTICVMDPDGANSVDVAQAKWGSTKDDWKLFPISWSPDVTHLAYQSGKDIYSVSVEAGVSVNLTNAGPNELNQYPSWSPDGTRIAFASTRAKPGIDIYVMNADGSNPVNLMEGQAGGGNTDRMPSWSPDGSKIAFTSNRAGDGAYNIFVMNADGTNPIQLTHETLGCGAVAWSPDGRRIAFDVYVRQASWEIDVMDLDGRNRVRVSEVVGGGNIDNESPSWSPDGSKIAFMSDRRSRHFDIWMVNADGSDPVRVSQVAIVKPRHMFPAWSPVPRTIAAPSAVRALSWGQVKAGGW